MKVVLVTDIHRRVTYMTITLRHDVEPIAYSELQFKKKVGHHSNCISSLNLHNNLGGG